MTEYLYDPISRYRLTLERDGENLIINARVDPGGGVPAHFHPRQEERFTVEQGQARFKVGRRKVLAGPGDEVVVPRGTKHSFKNTSGSETWLRAELRPALNAEGFFEETSAAARDGAYRRGGIPTSFRGAVRMARVLDRYRDDAVICMPPPFLQRILFAPLLRFSR